MSPIPLDETGRSPFRAAVEAKDFARVTATLAPDIHFRSPELVMMMRPASAVSAVREAMAEQLQASQP